MRGTIDKSGRALVRIPLRQGTTASLVILEVWIDTGFTGELVLPRSVIEQMKLIESGSVDAILADGSQIKLSTFTCVIDWFGAERQLEVIANEGDYPLLGVGLLLDLELIANYRTHTLTLELT